MTAGRSVEDPCYHEACDTVANLDTTALGEMADGVAHATWTLAKSRSGLFPDGSVVARTANARATRTYAGPRAIR